MNSASSASLLRSMAKRQLFGFLTLAASVLAQDRFKKHAERSADSLVRTNISLVAKTRGQGCPRSVLESALVLALLIFTPATNAKTSASAGWAEVDITPPLGIGLGGRGGPGTVAKKVLDRVAHAQRPVHHPQPDRGCGSGTENRAGLSCVTGREDCLCDARGGEVHEAGQGRGLRRQI